MYQYDFFSMHISIYVFVYGCMYIFTIFRNACITIKMQVCESVYTRTKIFHLAGRSIKQVDREREGYLALTCPPVTPRARCVIALSWSRLTCSNTHHRCLFTSSRILLCFYIFFSRHDLTFSGRDLLFNRPLMLLFFFLLPFATPTSSIFFCFWPLV